MLKNSFDKISNDIDPVTQWIINVPRIALFGFSRFGLEFLSKNARVSEAFFARDIISIRGRSWAKKTLTIPSKSWRNAIKAQLDAFVRLWWRRWIPKAAKATFNAWQILYPSRFQRIERYDRNHEACQTKDHRRPASVWEERERERDGLRHYCYKHFCNPQVAPSVRYFHQVVDARDTGDTRETRRKCLAKLNYGVITYTGLHVFVIFVFAFLRFLGKQRIERCQRKNDLTV